MATTVRLLSRYGNYPRNTNVTLSDQDANALLNRQAADLNTSLGVAYKAPKVTTYQVPISGQRAKGSSTSIPVENMPFFGKAKSSASGRAVAFGDSITLGVGLTNPASSNYAALIAAEQGWALTNLAVSGTIVSRWMDGQIGSLSVSPGDQFFTMAGFNDARWGGTDPSKLTQFQNALYAVLAHCSVPDVNKVFSQTASQDFNSNVMTYGGSWSLSPTWIGQQTVSRMGAYANAAGSYVETTVTGDCVDIMLGGQSTVGSSCFITIDGVRVGSAGTISPAPIVAPADGGAEVWQPYCVRFTGLADGKHVVRVTLATTAVLLVGYIAGWRSASKTLPAVYVGGTIRMLTSSYSIVPAGATDSVMRDYRSAVRQVCDTLAYEGSVVRFVDLDRVFSPTVGGLNGDSVHPLEMGQAQFKQAFTREINRPLLGQ